MPTDTPRVPIEEQIECARRELRYRGRVYTRRIAAGHMTQKLADHETRAMQAIIDTLEEVAAAGRLL